MALLVLDDQVKQQRHDRIARALRELLAIDDVVRLGGRVRLQCTDEPLRERRRFCRGQRMEPGIACCDGRDFGHGRTSRRRECLLSQHARCTFAQPRLLGWSWV